MTDIDILCLKGNTKEIFSMTKSQFSAIYKQYYVLFNTTVAVSFLLLNEIHNLSNNFMFSKLALSNEKDLNIL